MIIVKISQIRSTLLKHLYFLFHRFMESELELHEEIQKLHVLATVPEYYDVFVKLNSVSTCLGLLNHENSGMVLNHVSALVYCGEFQRNTTTLH